jgi:hypothetical protein
VENLNTLILILGFMITMAMMYSLCGHKSAGTATGAVAGAATAGGRNIIKSLFALTKLKLVFITLFLLLGSYILLTFKIQPSGFSITMNDKILIEQRMERVTKFGKDRLNDIKNLLP